MATCSKCRLPTEGGVKLCPMCDCPPEVIKARAAKIREEWSENEYWKRAGYSDGIPPVETKVVRGGVEQG